jgi:hypothetical protein
VFFWKTFNFDDFALAQFIACPIQGICTAEFSFSTAVIDLPVILKRTIINFAKRLNEQHQLFDGVPAIHEHPVSNAMSLKATDDVSISRT